MLESSFMKPFLEEIFWPANSKGLRLRSAAFEMQLSHGVWGSLFESPPTVCRKTVSSLLGEGM